MMCCLSVCLSACFDFGHVDWQKLSCIYRMTENFRYQHPKYIYGPTEQEEVKYFWGLNLHNCKEEKNSSPQNIGDDTKVTGVNSPCGILPWVPAEH